ncbi:hypothetical protein TVAG_305420 [Trichomonas vaginalis G3]|uniref:HECT-type E3 ubiquitin transferase n=1 Tax=Trichomonas vaginalis (strain ATCC PRA-98 / G3) TaxID=412133 RepID=A2ERB6_TRIV3|nr:ubiquitin protein ligase protein [Trichomonas vaginalis G3]EAY04792.1 hypothetical protein TVAG_305420 [Trichomonas vaginalis G3]KAI5490993.1 ubiquitin protein ligase protein [Trichomonas vaginalis G3]|eukprot:XP_001317015.1 hypothetical protein [Trichomonas vaginalis G3]
MDEGFSVDFGSFDENTCKTGPLTHETIHDADKTLNQLIHNAISTKSINWMTLHAIQDILERNPYDKGSVTNTIREVHEYLQNQKDTLSKILFCMLMFYTCTDDNDIFKQYESISKDVISDILSNSNPSLLESVLYVLCLKGIQLSNDIMEYTNQLLMKQNIDFLGSERIVENLVKLGIRPPQSYYMNKKSLVERIISHNGLTSLSILPIEIIKDNVDIFIDYSKAYDIIMYCFQHNIKAIEYFVAFIDENNMNDEIWNILKNQSVHLPFKLNKYAIQKSKESLSDAEYCFKFMSYALDYETIKEIIKNSQNKDLLKDINLSELIDISIKDNELWSNIIVRYVATADAYESFLLCYAEDLNETVSEMISIFVNDEKKLEALQRFLTNLIVSHPNITIDPFSSPNALNKIINVINDIPYTFWKVPFTIQSTKIDQNLDDDKKISLFIAFSISSLFGYCSLDPTSFSSVKISDKEFKEINDFIHSKDFTATSLFVPKSFSNQSKIFYYHSILYWNSMHFAHDKNYSFFPPVPENVLYFVYIGGKIADSMEKFETKTRINAIAYCKYFYDSINDNMSHINKNCYDCLELLLEYIVRDISSIMKTQAKSRASLYFTIDFLKNLWKSNLLNNNVKLSMKFINAFLNLFNTKFDKSLAMVVIDNFHDVKDDILKMVSKYAIPIVCNFLSNGNHELTLSLKIDPKDINSAIFDIFFSDIKINKITAKNLLGIAKIVRKINHPYFTERFLNCCSYLNNDSIYAIIPFIPSSYYSPNDKELLIKKVVDYIMTTDEFVISNQFDKILSMLMDYNDRTLSQVYSLMYTRESGRITLTSIFSQLIDSFLDTPPTYKTITMIYRPIERTSNLNFVFRENIDQFKLTSSTFLNFIEEIIHMLNTEYFQIALFILQLLAIKSPLHFLYMRNVSISKLFDDIFAIGSKYYQNNSSLTYEVITTLKFLTQVAGLSHLFIQWSIEKLNSDIEKESIFIILEVFFSLTQIDLTNHSPTMKIILNGWVKLFEMILKTNNLRVIELSLLIHKNLVEKTLKKKNSQVINYDKFIHAEDSFLFVYKTTDLFHSTGIYIQKDVELDEITKINRSICHNWNSPEEINRLTKEFIFYEEKSQFLDVSLNNVPDDIKLMYYQSNVPNVPKLLDINDIQIIEKSPDYVEQWISGDIQTLETCEEYEKLIECLSILNSLRKLEVQTTKIPQIYSTNLFDALVRIFVQKNTNQKIRIFCSEILANYCTDGKLFYPIFSKVEKYLNSNDIDLNEYSNLLIILNSSSQNFIPLFESKILNSLCEKIQSKLYELTQDSMRNYLQIISKVKNSIDIDITSFIKYSLIKCVSKCENYITSIWLKMNKEGKGELQTFVRSHVEKTLLQFDQNTKYEPLTFLKFMTEDECNSFQKEILNALDISLKFYHPGRAKSISSMINVVCPRRDHSGPLKQITKQFIEDQMKSNMKINLPKSLCENDFWAILKRNEKQVEFLSNDIESLNEVVLFKWYPEIVSFPMKHKDFVRKERSKLNYCEFDIEIERNKIIEDTISTILDKSDMDIMKSIIYVHFVGEKGIDEGGLFKDWISSFISSIFDEKDSYFYLNERGRHEPKKIIDESLIDDYDDLLMVYGMILGRALIEDIPINRRMESYFYKFLKDRKPTIRDVKAIDEQIYDSLMYIKENDVTDLCLTFSLSIDNKTIKLIENGENVDVTNENKEKYIELYINQFILRDHEREYKIIRDGFYSVISKEELNCFTPLEVELAICGYSVIDVEDFIKCCSYEHPFTKDHQTVKMFYDAIRTFSNEEMNLLISFITGMSQVPSGDLSIVLSSGGDPPRLPTAHTCVNMINIPLYSSVEEMSKMLKIAITNCKSFEFA